MSIVNISTLSDFISYIKRALGEPKIRVELDETQIIDRIDDALQKFYEYHYDGTTKKIITFDYIEGQTDYILPETVKAVLKLYAHSSELLSGERLLLYPQFDAYSTRGMEYSMKYSIVDYEIFKQKIELFKDGFEKELIWDFNATTKRLRLFGTSSNEKLAIEAYVSEDNDENVFNNKWLREYAIALCGIQWAVNISKYGGIALPGGGQLNYDLIESRYKEMKERLEEDLIESYTEPPMFLKG